MQRSFQRHALLSVLFACASAGAFAQATPADASSARLQADLQRNANQQARIDQGVKSGALTTRETARLEAGQARIDQREAVAAADGKVTKKEQRGIRRAENRASRHIHHQKHDAQS